MDGGFFIKQKNQGETEICIKNTRIQKRDVVFINTGKNSFPFPFFPLGFNLVFILLSPFGIFISLQISSRLES